MPGVSTEDYPKVLDVFPDGCFHLYDNMFFYTNLKENVSLRVHAFLEARQTHRNTVSWIVGAAAAALVLSFAGCLLIHRRKNARA